MTEPSPLDRLTASYVDIWWHLDPVEGSGAGRASDDQRLGSFSEDGIREHLAALRALMAAVEELEVSSLDDEIDRTALLYAIRVADHRFRREVPHRRDPSLWTGHVLEALHQLLLVRDRERTALAHAAGERLAAIPGFLREAQATLEACPRVLLETALAAMHPGGGLIDEVAAAYADVAEGNALAVRARDAREALVGFESHLRGMLQEPLPDEPWGIGREALEFRLAHQHVLAASTEELLRYAAGLIEETERELAVLAHGLGDRSWQDAVARLRDDAVDAEALVATYREAMVRAREHVRAMGLAALPEAPLEVTATPAYAVPWTPVAAYLPPGPLARDRTGIFFVTRPDGAGVGHHARAGVAATTVHEGFPGHHLHLLTTCDLPRPVRRLVLTPIMVEGWALYAEGVMDETGFYRTPEERLFRLVALLWRALRIPLDVGVHTGALSYGDAVDLMVGRLGVTRSRAEAEVRRVYTSPASQLAYAVGCRELLAIRGAYQRRAGSTATLRDFHDALLAYGALPPGLARWGLGLND